MSGTEFKTKRCLIFGGNGFIGAETVKCLFSNPECAHWDVTLVNRGKSWDWDTKKLVEPFVSYIQCNRKKQLSVCGGLVSYVKESPIDIVVDFSAFDPFAVEEAVELLDGCVGLYVLISSDSVYEVCEKQQSGPTKETDAVRPHKRKKRKELASADLYGHKKLKCEEVLQRHRANGGNIPFIVLRLADVIGERDSTDRWLQYHLWLKAAVCCSVPIVIPESLTKCNLSFVYVQDVAELIQNLMKRSAKELVPLHGEAFNLAFVEQCTIQNFLTEMKSSLQLKKSIPFVYAQDAPQVYPSVEKGPVSISKAQCVLGWKPTPFWKAMLYTAKFYENVIHSVYYHKRIKRVFRELLTDIEGVVTVDLIKDRMHEIISYSPTGNLEREESLGN